MSKPKIILTRRWPEAVESKLAEKYETVINESNVPFDTAKMRNALETADAVCPTVTDKMGAEVFEGLTPKAKIIGNFGVGYSHIDTAAATQTGMVITNTPDVLSECTADIAITAMMMIARRAGEGERLLRAGKWEGWNPTQLMGQKLSGKTIGIVGFGRIGQETAKRAHFGLGMNVLALKRSEIDPQILKDTGATRVGSLDELVEKSDVVSLHCPGGDANRHLINADIIAKMKPTAYLINTARGEVVDDDALIAALKAGKIAGAGLDVFDGEPNINKGYMDCENAVLLPHLGSATTETREAMGFRVMENLDAFFAGKTPGDLVS